MSETYDFERAWLAKFSNCLDKVAGEEIRKEVMAGSESLSSHSSRQEVIDWSKRAMERLESLVDEERRRAVMTGCACQYPKSELQTVRKQYETTRDIDLVHRMLQEQFESFLRDTLALSDELTGEVVRRGWGLAGVKNPGHRPGLLPRKKPLEAAAPKPPLTIPPWPQTGASWLFPVKRGNTIIAIKIPKSGYLVEYMKETDPEKKRQYYCHCPRIRDVLKTSETISTTYCYCGAGFYKGIWEEILQKPVEVEVLESVLQGDEVCKIAVYLPSDQ